ncbi:ABC-2 type transport system ATP-binding protein [Pelagirhabdus alkalitolerans]|uniref:ABC-2 type transport system ATP-binding protein n=1 Tax=Pelagirhabdus alkalitolerans TaxID=1612202 RepID=A0A1G6M3U1_9BACI|nr:ABC transporter ATP-binding protein [Pelagirhabdus alkalitolerans]SDC50027.1 ABC-2 type transport system ATP-binding protein [Pelagirhabdus alkalitolerans]
MGIECVGVSKSIKKHSIISDVSFKFHNGIIYGLSGENASGKTTIMRLLSGIDSPSQGQILINEFNIFMNKKDALKHVGVHIEYARLYPFMTGRQNLDCFLNKKEKDNPDFELLIKDFGLTESINKKVSSYSLGMKQKLSLIIALMRGTNCLLLDEPTNGLDDKSISVFKKVICKYAKHYKTTILIATHEIQDLQDIFDYIFKIEDGVLNSSSKK